MELQFGDQCPIYLYGKLVGYCITFIFFFYCFTAAENERKAVLEASPLISVVNAFKQQLMSPWRYSKRVLKHVLEQTVDLIFFYGHSLLLATAACYFPIEQNGITMEKSERALKRFLFVFGDLLPLCSPVDFLSCVFLHTYVDFFNNRCGVTFLLWEWASVKSSPLALNHCTPTYTRTYTQTEQKER